MISIDTWPFWIAITVAGGPIFLACAGITYGLHLSRHHMDAIKEALKNSRYIYIWGPSLGKRGLIWSMLEISKITGMLTWPKPSIRIGELNPDDFERFPLRLKYRLKSYIFFLVVGGIWQMIAFVLIKLR